MKKSIKISVWARIAVNVIASVAFSVIVGVNLGNINRAEEASNRAGILLSQAQNAEVAHYKWAVNLSNALYEDMNFTGSIDHTACALGQWIYGDAWTTDPEILALREEIEPIHRELHASAVKVLEMKTADLDAAQSYYKNTIQSNVELLVGKLDGIVARSNQLQQEISRDMMLSTRKMQTLTNICALISLVCLISLAVYVLKHIVKPILDITQSSSVMLKGDLNLQIEHDTEDELGHLAGTLRSSMQLIASYVADIDRMMQELSQGNFDVASSSTYIGDFVTIKTAMDGFTTEMSQSIARINEAATQVSNGAEQISNSAQSLASGATEQGNLIEGLFTTLEQLSDNSKRNADVAISAQEDARLTGSHMSTGGEQIGDMVQAMADIDHASQEISHIISTIENIAFQTNILALNAAVEAARAGAAGKGFAVVADEVRSLATQSDRAAKATKELIDNSLMAVQRGSRIVKEVSQTMEETLELATRSTDQIGVIADAVQRESAAIAQIVDGVRQISAVVQTNAATSEESAAISEELFSQTRMLNEQTRGFRLKGTKRAGMEVEPVTVQ